MDTIRTTISTYLGGTKEPTQTWAYKKKHNNENDIGRSDTQSSCTSRLLGIEIELENVIINTPKLNYWSAIEDNSLKINGREFTLPVTNNKLKEALFYLFHNITANTSSRCSVHVHANILDLTLDNLNTLVALYIIFEKALFNFSGNRNNSNYCVPVTDLILPRQLFTNIGYLQEYLTKYTAIHLFAQDKHGKTLGTLEFRHLKGTMDINYIDTWAQIITNLVNFSKAIPFSELTKLIFDMRTTSSYNQLATDIFKDYKKLLTDYETFNSDIESNITFLKLIIG